MTNFQDKHKVILTNLKPNDNMSILDMYEKILSVSKSLGTMVESFSKSANNDDLIEDLKKTIENDYSWMTVESIEFNKNDLNTMAIDCVIDGKQWVLSRVVYPPDHNIAHSLMESKSPYLPNILFGYSFNDEVAPTSNAFWYLTANTTVPEDRYFTTRDIKAIIREYLKAVASLSTMNLYNTAESVLKSLTIKSDPFTNEITSIQLIRPSTIVLVRETNDTELIDGMVFDSIESLMREFIPRSREMSDAEHSLFNNFYKKIRSFSLQDLINDPFLDVPSATNSVTHTN